MDLKDWLDEIGLGAYAAVFESQDITFDQLAVLTEADLRELGLSIGHRKRLRDALAALADEGRPLAEAALPPEPTDDVPHGDLGALVRHRFPFPIAYGYRRVVAPESAVNAVDCVFYTYTALLRFTALTFLGQFLSSPGQNPNAAKALRQLKSPTLESWLTAVTTLGKHLFPPAAGSGQGPT